MRIMTFLRKSLQKDGHPCWKKSKTTLHSLSRRLPLRCSYAAAVFCIKLVSALHLSHSSLTVLLRFLTRKKQLNVVVGLPFLFRVKCLHQLCMHTSHFDVVLHTHTHKHTRTNTHALSSFLLLFFSTRLSHPPTELSLTIGLGAKRKIKSQAACVFL